MTDKPPVTDDSAPAACPASDPAPGESAVPWHDADFIDVLWAYMLREFPQIAGPRLDQVKRAVRHEFGGDRHYVSKSESSGTIAREVLRLFNGRNATEVARELSISRASVYRYIKQAGRST